MKARLVWIIILLSLFSLSAYGQYVPLGSLPMQYNSSFAGEAGVPRISTNSQYYGGKWDHGFSKTAFSTDMSYDQFITKLHSGIGFTAGIEKGKREFASLWNGSQVVAKDRDEWNKRYFSIDVAPKFSIKGKYTLSPSLNLNYIKVEAEYNDGQLKERMEEFSSRIGLLWNTSKYYIGLSFNGINNINYYYQQGHSKRPYQLWASLQLGYTFQKNSDSKFSFTPQIALNLIDILDRTRYQYEYTWEINGLLAGFNLNFRYSKFIWGLNNGGVHMGLQTDRLRLMATNKPRIIGENLYIGNLSFRYAFMKKAGE